MKRGVLNLTKDELKLLSTHLRDLEYVPANLLETITPERGRKDSTLELSEEDVESLLDCLPMPDAQEQQLVTQTRNQLRTFLSQLRPTNL